MITVAALFVEADGAYAHLPGVECWTEASSQGSLLGAGARADARLYHGPHVVVAHPPCSTWCQLAKVNEARYGHAVGSDAGCFASALASVRQCGGVLEHPAYTHAWPRFDLPRPTRGVWSPAGDHGELLSWVTEVSQSAYGHRARKRTWLYYVGEAMPPELDWRDPEGTAWCGHNNPDRARMGARGKPTLSKAEAKASPIAFRDLLLSIARSARNP